jgi:hypothetical protein
MTDRDVLRRPGSADTFWTPSAPWLPTTSGQLRRTALAGSDKQTDSVGRGC